MEQLSHLGSIKIKYIIVVYRLSQKKKNPNKTESIRQYQSGLMLQYNDSLVLCKVLGLLPVLPKPKKKIEPIYNLTRTTITKTNSRIISCPFL